jgi:ATP-dependent Clp protease ATP-binding subunit ClpX
VQVEDLMEYGMIAELLGRLPVVTELHDLSEDHLVRIITEPPDSILREYQRLFALDGVELRLSDGAIRAIAHFAGRRKLGARSLRAIFEDVMADLMFEAPERRGQTIVVDADHVRARLHSP